MPILSLHYASTLQTMLVFVPMYILIIALCVHFVSTELSDTIIRYSPLPPDAIPWLCLMWTIVNWNITFIFYRMGIVIDADMRGAKICNHHPRAIPATMKRNWLYRLHCAHMNTGEYISLFVAGLCVAAHLDLNDVVIAKYSLITTLARSLYPFCYVFKQLNGLRVATFLLGMIPIYLMGFTAIYRKLYWIKW